ncbi:MAG: hypothetical protein JWR61_3637 [Ferruginibacter sp.]|nr:hypothetical protein [Ferruginibacter sp.]
MNKAVLVLFNYAFNQKMAHALPGIEKNPGNATIVR